MNQNPERRAPSAERRAPTPQRSFADVMTQTDLRPPAHLTLVYTVVMTVLTGASSADIDAGAHAFNVAASVIGTAVAALLAWRVMCIARAPQELHAARPLTWVAVVLHLIVDLGTAFLGAIFLVWCQGFLTLSFP